MVSAKVIAANRLNAQKSTGPRTPEGKATVAFNPLKHGLLSREVLLPQEDEADFVKFGKRFYADLKPEGELETLLVDLIIAGAWRLRRVMAIEARIFQNKGSLNPASYQFETSDLGQTFMRAERDTDAFSKLSRYEVSIEREMFRALHELQRLQAARAGQPVPAPTAVDVDVTGVPEGAPGDGVMHDERRLQVG